MEPGDSYTSKKWVIFGSDYGLSSYLWASDYLNQCWLITSWMLKNKLQWNLNQDVKFFIEEIHLKMLAILFRPQWVNSLWHSDTIWRHQSWSTLAQIMAWCRHQAITWTNVDLSSVRSSGIHLSAILQEMPQPSVTKISLKFTYLKLCSNLPGANELTEVGLSWDWRWWWKCVILIDGLAQDCSISSALAMELLQSCTNPSK